MSLVLHWTSNTSLSPVHVSGEVSDLFQHSLDFNVTSKLVLLLVSSLSSVVSLHSVDLLGGHVCELVDSHLPGSIAMEVMMHDLLQVLFEHALTKGMLLGAGVVLAMLSLVLLEGIGMAQVVPLDGCIGRE